MKKKTYERIKAIELRRNGMSINRIADILDVSKSSVSLWVKNVHITSKQKKELMHRSFKHTDKAKKKISDASKESWKNNPNMVTVGNSYFRKVELQYKDAIESMLHTKNMRPKFVENHWFDFVDDKYIVELTKSNTGGINNAIKRFQDIKGEDKRIKILICPFKWFGNIRKKKLRDVGVQFIDIKHLER